MTLGSKSVFILAIALIAPAALEAQMQWTFAPYLWGSDITVRADVNGVDTIDRTAQIKTTLDKTNFAGMLYLEGRGEHYGFFIDTTYLNTGSETTTVNATPAALARVEHVEGDFKSALVDAVVFLRPGGPTSGLDVFIGARLMDIDQKLDFTFNGITPIRRVQVSRTLANGIAGIRYTAMLSPTWDLSTRLDAGAGDAKFTWNAQATVGYWFGDRKNMSVRGGWKYMEMKYEEDQPGVDGGTHIDSKLELSGPLVGFLFRW